MLRLAGYSRSQFRSLLDRSDSANTNPIHSEVGDSPKYRRRSALFRPLLSTPSRKSIDPVCLSWIQNGMPPGVASDCSVKMVDIVTATLKPPKLYSTIYCTSALYRTILFNKRRMIGNYCLFLVLFGILLMVFETELGNMFQVPYFVGFSLRVVVMLSSLILVGFIVFYHILEAKIYLNGVGAKDWTLALSLKQILSVVVEVTVCILCPLPVDFTVHWPVHDERYKTVSNYPVSLNALLSIPMFLRSYWICRFMVLHSTHYKNTSTRCIAAMNNVSVDFWFILKTLIFEHPIRALVSVVICFWVTCSWIFTLCERHSGPAYSNGTTYANSLWFISVSFMSIGYGDVVPHTYCGRTLAITTGIMGATVSYALIGVIATRIHLSKSETKVNEFLAESRLFKEWKHTAASVIQQTWRIHRQRMEIFDNYTIAKCTSSTEKKLWHFQRKFIKAILRFRSLKREREAMSSKNLALSDIVLQVQKELQESIWQVRRDLLAEIRRLNSHR